MQMGTGKNTYSRLPILSLQSMVFRRWSMKKREKEWTMAHGLPAKRRWDLYRKILIMRSSMQQPTSNFSGSWKENIKYAAVIHKNGSLNTLPSKMIRCRVGFEVTRWGK